MVAVTAGDGLAAIFRDFGVASVVQGGQSANPSTGELLEAVGAVPAKEVLLLPNNPNVILAARQVASMTDRPVQVVPTRNAAEGFAALLALDPGMDAAANVGPMTEAGRAIQTVVVTEAVRDATIGGRKVKRGQTIALDPDDGLIAAANDREKCVINAVAALTSGYELITMFYGDGADLAETEAMARKIGTVVPGRGDRGPPRRPAVLPVPDLGRVAGPDGAARERTRAPRPPKVPPPPTDPVELLRTPLARSGLTAAGLLRRAGIRLGWYDVRDLLFHLPRRYDDLRETVAAGRSGLGGGGDRRLGAGAGG